MFDIVLCAHNVVFDGVTPIDAWMSDAHFPGILVEVVIDSSKPDQNGGLKMVVVKYPSIIHKGDELRGVYYPSHQFGTVLVNHPAYS